MEEISTVRMPKSFEHRISMEFKKPFFRDWDRQFIIILFFSLIIEILIVTIMARRPIEDYSAEEITRIQEQFANFVLGKVISKEKEIISPDGGIGSTKREKASKKVDEEVRVEEKKGNVREERSIEVRRAERLAAAEARRRSREAISREVSNKGILGLLTGTGSATEGKAVSSLLGNLSNGKGIGTDLDNIISSVNGLKTNGGSGSGRDGGSGLGSVRGDRSRRKANIDDLVSDLGNARSESLSRKGELKIETPAEVVGTGRKSIHRSPEALQEVIMSHNSAIQYCYERELKRIPNLKGKLTIRITVSPNGTVKDVSVLSSTLNNERVERCILARIRLWKDFKPIDPSDGEISFRQIYVFGY